MGCGNCATGACATTPAGCKGNGGCGSGGCNKLNTFDWFGGMLPPETSENQALYEVRFKNTRKAFYVNVNSLSLITGDTVVVESDRGFDVGQISLSGVLATLQMKKKRVKSRDKVRKIYRTATHEDVDKLQTARSRELHTMIRTREIAKDLELEMKISDVEFQGDNTKAIFYYIADQRVDFRRLIKILADEFRIRVEMKQIGLRHEAGLVGGIGSCGRELCCSTWLSDFKTVSTSAARYQNLSLNPMKISGQCGRLKCCLNFELETYLHAIEDIPNIDRIETDMGIGRHQKTDIFKRIMWFCYEGESSWVPLTVDIVNQMVEMNSEGKKPASLRALDEVVEAELDFVDVVGQSVLRESPKRRKKGQGRGRGKGRGGQQGQNRGRNQRNSGRGGGGRQQNRQEGQARNKQGGEGQGRENKEGKEGEQPQNRSNQDRSGESRGRGGRGGNNRGGNNRGRNSRNRGGGENRNPRGRGGGNRNRPNKDGEGGKGNENKGPAKPDNPS